MIFSESVDEDLSYKTINSSDNIDILVGHTVAHESHMMIISCLFNEEIWRTVASRPS